MNTAAQHRRGNAAMNNPTEPPATQGLSYMARGHYVFSNERVKAFAETGSDADALRVAAALNRQADSHIPLAQAARQQERIEALEAALRRIAYSQGIRIGQEAKSMQEIARKAIASSPAPAKD